MIVYATKQTVKAVRLPLVEDLQDPQLRALATDIINTEAGDHMLEWGMKLFYFDHRKCLQVIHIASRMTIFMAGIEDNQVSQIGHFIATYMLELFSDDQEMQRLIDRFLTEHPILLYDRLKDKSIIAHLNLTQRNYLLDGERLAQYIDGGIMHTLKLSKDYNLNYLIKYKDPSGKQSYRFPGKVFEEQLKAYYSKGN